MKPPPSKAKAPAGKGKPQVNESLTRQTKPHTSQVKQAARQTGCLFPFPHLCPITYDRGLFGRTSARMMASEFMAGAMIAAAPGPKLRGR